MSPDVTQLTADPSVGLPAPRRRYPVQIHLRYKVLRDGFVAARGSGKSREFGGGKLSFHADSPLLEGADLELALDWPLRLEGVCPLQLVVFGRVIASNQEGSTLEIVRHEFRTRGTQIRAAREAVQRSGFRVHVGTTAIHARRG